MTQLEGPRSNGNKNSEQQYKHVFVMQMSVKKLYGIKTKVFKLEFFLNELSLTNI